MLNPSSRAPFLPVFLLIAVGIGLGTTYVGWKIALTCLLITAAIWYRLEVSENPWAVWFFCLLVFFSGTVLGQTTKPFVEFQGEQYEIRGIVQGVRGLSYYQRVRLQASPSIQLAVHLPLSQEVSVGDELQLSEEVTPPRRAGNPGEFCYYSYLSRTGVWGVVEPQNEVVVSQHASSRSVLLLLQERVNHNLQPIDSVGLLRALVLGDRDNLCQELEEGWRRLGIQHLMAISGMHIGLFALLCGALLHRMIKHSSLRLLCFALIIGGYVLISGGRPSAWRAFLVCMMAVVGKELGYRGEPLHYWSTAGLVLLLASPGLIQDLGFQLSFVATGGILLFAPVINRIQKRLSGKMRWISGSLLVSVVAQVSLYPLLALHFQEISLLAPIATILFLPLVTGLLVLGVLIGVVGLPLGWLVSYLFSAEEILRNLLFHLPGFFSVSVPSPYQLVTWYLLFLLLGSSWRRNYLVFPKCRVVRIGLVLLAVSCFFSLPPQYINPLEVTVLDVGQGDAIFIQTPFGQSILIDGGGDTPYWQARGRNVGLNTVVPFLQYRGVKKLDLVILTHPHEDHIHGLLAVLESIPIGLLVDNGRLHTTRSYQRYLELIEKQSINRQVVTAGDSLSLRGGISLDFWSSSSSTSMDLNNGSVVVALTYQDRRLLFAGDLDSEGQRYLISGGAIKKVDWLKVPHHGSINAWYPPFYRLLNPDFAVISVGPNYFGHPSSHLINGLVSQGTKVFQTDLDGAVTFYLWGPFFGRVSRR